MIMFHSPNEFAGLPHLMGHWTTVRDELDGLSRNAFMKWPETNIYDGNWTVFPLFKIGKKVEANCLLCPETTRMLEAIPGMITAGFSSLAPGTYIGPHYGYTNEVLRCHLGLKPARDCAIRVGTEIRQWTPGSCFVFDDTIEHEAWNRGDETRVVLLLDFKRDPTRAVVFPDAVYNY
jgi:aspartyl/asparaginyl beta-hydroxylase (cupin superfamily)